MTNEKIQDSDLLQTIVSIHKTEFVKSFWEKQSEVYSQSHPTPRRSILERKLFWPSKWRLIEIKIDESKTIFAK